MFQYTVFLFFSSLILGVVMHRSDFCLAGAFRDIWLFKRFLYIKALLLIFFLNLLLFQLFYNFHIISYLPYPLTGYPNLGNIIGGFVFGIGMVLSGGCVIGVLYKMATGAIIYGVAFLGIIIGSIIYILNFDFFNTIKNYFVFGNSLTLDELLNINPVLLKILIICPILIFFINLYGKNSFNIKSHAKGFINPFFASIVISVGSLITYIITGMPIGVTSIYTKFGVFLMNFIEPHLNEKIAAINYFSMNYYNAFLDKTLTGGYNSKFDGITIVELPVVLGILSGSLLSSISLREFNLKFNAPSKQFLSALTGGILMGLGSRIGNGCNVKHLLGGLSILANSSLLFVGALLTGSFVGSIILKKELL